MRISDWSSDVCSSDLQWVAPAEAKTADVINPATEAVSGRISLASLADVEKAVAAARKAFASWSQTTREQRLDVLLAIQVEYARRQNEIGEAITEEMGAQNALGCGFHIGLGGGPTAAGINETKTHQCQEDTHTTTKPAE